MPGLNVMLFMNKFITKPLEYISQSPLKVIWSCWQFVYLFMVENKTIYS